jgi:glutathione S-transferase
MAEGRVMNLIVAGHGGASTLALAVTLGELGQSYEVACLDLLNFGQWQPDHRRLSAAGEPVVLVASELAMDNPLLAMLYLAEKGGSSGLLPDDPADIYLAHALMAQWTALMSGPLGYLGWHARTPQDVQRDYLGRLERHPQRPVLSGWSAVWRDAVPEDRRAADAKAKVDNGIAMIGSRLGHGEWLVGEQLSLADIMAFALLYDAQTIPGGSIAELAPPTARWFAAMANRSAVTLAQRQLQISGLDNIRCAPVFA